MNERVKADQLTELYYGDYIVSIQLHHPSMVLPGMKSDFKYRHTTMHGSTMAKCIFVVDKTALLGLRLTFGRTPCTSEWCISSEPITNLANDILHAKDWDPNELCLPHSVSLSCPILQPQDKPFGKAMPINMHIPADDMGKVDDFIDDLITIIPHIRDNWKRGEGTSLLAIHTVSCPLHPEEPLPRDNVLSVSKLKDEGRMSEIITVLGWVLNLCALEINLPLDKYTSWLQDITSMAQSCRATFKELDTLVGCLNHVGHIIPLAHYFLNRIRHFKERS